MSESLDLKPNNPTESKERPKRRILVADDDEVLRRMAVDFFTFKYGDEVVAVSNGQEILNKVFSEKFDAALFDNDMSKAGGTETDGIDTLRQIRTKSELDNLPVILWSGTLNDDIRKEVNELKNSRCFEKPVSVDTIKENLEEMIEEAERVKEAEKEISEKPEQ